MQSDSSFITMNPQSPDHCCDDCDFYEVAEEFSSGGDVTEAPQVSSGGDVTDYSDSQRLHHCPNQEDDLQVSKGSSSDIHCPKQEGDLQVSKGPLSDVLTSPQEEEEHGDQKSFVEDMKKTSTLPQNPQDQQQQQSPPVKFCSNPHLKEEQEVGEKKEEDIEHSTADQKGKALQEFDGVGNSHFTNSITSTVEEQGTVRPILCSVEEKQQSDPSQNPQDQQPPEVGKIMENIEHQTVDHEGKCQQEVDDVGYSHFTNSITSTIEEQGTIPPILFSPEEEQRSDPKNLVEEIKEGSVPCQYPTVDHEGKTLQEVDDAGNSHFTNSITSTVEEQGTIPPILCSPEEQQESDPKNLVEEIKKGPIPSQNPQDQQQQQPPPVGRLCSDRPALEDKLGKIMAEDLLEHQTVNHEGKPSEEAGPASDCHSSNNIESTEVLQPPNSEAEEKISAEKVIPSENDDKRAIGSSHNRNPKRFLSVTKTLLCVVVSTFALMMVGKLLPRRSEMHGFNMQKKKRAAMRK